MQGLGLHDIVGIVLVTYTVIDDNGDKVNILIWDSIHVQTLDIHLILIQQPAQQNNNPRIGGHVTGDYLKLT